MQETITALKQHRQNADQKAFFQTIIRVAPGLERYVRNRLRTAENKGLIPTGLYSPDDILDEVMLRVDKDFENMPREDAALRVTVFQIANKLLDDIVWQEAWHKRAVSLESILADEMKMLDEINQITADADGHILMIEDLDDSELEPPEPRVLLLEGSFEDEILDAAGVDLALVKVDEARRAQLARVYDQLPEQSRIIFDLWTRGGLTVEEIAQVRAISADHVRAAIERIQAQIGNTLAR